MVSDPNRTSKPEKMWNDMADTKAKAKRELIER
jgi:hypothetical protein